MKPIRVGLIRCDLHAIYYGALMAKHDPLVLRSPPPTRSGKMQYSWQPGGAHFYFYTHYGNPKRMSVPHVGGMRITRIWDEDREFAESASAIFCGVPQVCDTFEEASDDVDLVFIADCNFEGKDHLKLATPSLKKGVPTFVDKPFAYDVKDAKAIVRLAEKHETPVLSLSILRSVPHFARFRKRFAEIGGAAFGTIHGGGLSLAGQIHSISLAQQLFGNGVECVGCMGKEPTAHLYLGYGDRRNRPARGVVLNCHGGGGPHCAFYASAYGPQGAVHSPAIGDYQFPWGAAKNIRLAKQMVQTGKPPVPYQDMIENIAVATAARRAAKLGRTVRIREVWKPKR